jgi:hypothetical protein
MKFPVAFCVLSFFVLFLRGEECVFDDNNSFATAEIVEPFKELNFTLCKKINIVDFYRIDINTTKPINALTEEISLSIYITPSSFVQDSIN